MNRLLLLTILVLIFCLQPFGQDKSECPKVEITGPTEPFPSGNSIAFVVTLTSDIKYSKIEYKWTVSKGEIQNGQGTVAVVVATFGERNNQIITATLEIKGLPEGCNNIFTKSVEMVSQRIIDPIIPDKLSGKSSFNDVIARLMNLSLSINNEQGSSGEIVFRVSNNSERNWATSQQKNILKSLKRLNIPKDKIMMEIEKGKVFETEFIFIPPHKN